MSCTYCNGTHDILIAHPSNGGNICAACIDQLAVILAKGRAELHQEVVRLRAEKKAWQTQMSTLGNVLGWMHEAAKGEEIAASEQATEAMIDTSLAPEPGDEPETILAGPSDDDPPLEVPAGMRLMPRRK